MAAIPATTPTLAGVLGSATAASASDTVDQTLLGSRGAYLQITNGGGSTDNVTITDYSATRAGSTLPSNAFTATAVTAGAVSIIWIKPEQVNPATGLVTITNSFTTSVQYRLYPLQ